MEFLSTLWLPILLSAVAVFIVSAIIHMVLGYHKNDAVGLAAEDEVMALLREKGFAAGDYVMPHAGSMAAMKSEAYLARCAQGPVGFFTLLPGGSFAMGKSLVQWFVFCVVVGVFTAYVTNLALLPGAEYLAVHRVAGCVAFMAYALGGWPQSIWYKRKWSTTWKNTFDGLVYGLITGGFFGWLWPAA